MQKLNTTKQFIVRLTEQQYNKLVKYCKFNDFTSIAEGYRHLIKNIKIENEKS